ncbi:hypothetical protein HN51_004485 [Arachis hypogaea]|uniref:RING-type domain-containing protein n=1 Tax=Arachis hypogaea TaxID=3818 RepID=A0A445DID1_ARAHY|nr:uncharacterized protein LOC112796472 [Arachis hypogaea]QHO38057.1 Protein neuralized [Arachis hypogaea]RYR62938.1 hypothetical protein Ahy_A04g020696 [Arachis hypogaea]
MASSQVEIASSSPFGLVLRDRNHRGDGCRESNVVNKATHAALQRNIKNFVMDHLNMSMSMSNSDSTRNLNENNSAHWNEIHHNQDHDHDNQHRRHHRRHRNVSNLHVSSAMEFKDGSSLNSLISPRQTRLLDRWAAKQAREIVSNLESEAGLLSIDNNKKELGSTGSCNSDGDDNKCVDISNLAASSLVQIWEKRLSGSKPETTASNGAKTSPTAVTSTHNCDSEAGESSSCAVANEDWETHSDQSFSPQSRWSSCETATTEAERPVSVADIIKRLTTPSVHGDDNESEGFISSVASSPCRDLAPENSERRAFPLMIGAPGRIRGRRIFTDMLMQLERDRRGELNHLAERRAVSRFPQKGRIQSLLRLRLLQRNAAAENDKSQQKSTLSRQNKQTQESAVVMERRGKFSTAVEHRNAEQAEVAHPTTSLVQTVTNPVASDKSAGKDTCNQTVVHETANSSGESTRVSIPETNADHNKEKAHASSHVTLQETCAEVQNNDSLDTAKEPASMADDSGHNEIANGAESSEQQHAVEGRDATDQHIDESNYDDMLEEIEAMDQNYDATSYDWISEISRPRSYWEERRQAWYKEMLATSQNEDIRILLERKTVSTFLSSSFRAVIDRLMNSHKGTQTQLVNCQDDEDENQILMAYLQERMRSAKSPQEDKQEGGGEEEKRDEMQNAGQEEEQRQEQEQEQEQERCHEDVEYFPQSSSPCPSRTWSYKDNETCDDSDGVVFACASASTYSPSHSQPSQFQSAYHDNRRSSSPPNHHSMEMELIYDLRRQMEQLHHEMSELRKSIKSCVDMQIQMQLQQQSMVQTVNKEENMTQKKVPKKGNCCICHDNKADSILYRCGHMCACLKCANELQWNGGKCPICRAKILDVVRVYIDA